MICDKLTLLLLTLTLVSAPPLVCQAAPETKKGAATEKRTDVCLAEPQCIKIVDTARILSQDGQYQAALLAYQSAYSRWPVPWLLLNIGRMQEKTGQLQGAMDTYYKLLALPDIESDKELAEKARKFLRVVELELAKTKRADEPSTTTSPDRSAVSPEKTPDVAVDPALPISKSSGPVIPKPEVKATEATESKSTTTATQKADVNMTDATESKSSTTATQKQQDRMPDRRPEADQVVDGKPTMVASGKTTTRQAEASDHDDEQPVKPGRRIPVGGVVLGTSAVVFAAIGGALIGGAFARYDTLTMPSPIGCKPSCSDHDVATSRNPLYAGYGMFGAAGVAAILTAIVLPIELRKQKQARSVSLLIGSDAVMVRGSF